MEREKERENKKNNKIKIKIRKLGFRKLKKKNWKVGDIGKKQKGNQHLSNY
jgi:hypothetical protein